MRRRNKLILFIGAIVLMIMVGIIVFLILSEPERVLRRVIGVEPNKGIVLSKKARDLDGIWIRYSYELVFTDNEYDEVIKKICNSVGASQKEANSTEYIGTDIQCFVEGDVGFPPWKHWFDPQEESVVWVLDGSFQKILVSMDNSGNYHAYIQWEWSPFQKMIH